MAPRSRRSRGGISRPLALLVLLLVIAAGVAWWIAHQRAGDVEVYFVRMDAGSHRGSLAPVRRAAPPGPVQGRLEAALHQLLDGPDKRGPEGERALISEIPGGTALLGLEVGGGTVTVNLSQTYAAGGGSTSMLARVWQVVYTATQFPEAPAARILIEGRRVDALGGEGVMIGAPLRRPAVPPSF